MYCCLCGPLETAQPFGGDTPAVVARFGLHSQCGSLCRGLRAWPVDRCSSKYVGGSECKTPTPCATDRCTTQHKLQRPENNTQCTHEHPAQAPARVTVSVGSVPTRCCAITGIPGCKASFLSFCTQPGRPCFGARGSRQARARSRSSRCTGSHCPDWWALEKLIATPDDAPAVLTAA